MSERGRKRHTPEQIIRKLREADGMLAAGQTIGQVVQALEVSEQTFHRWRNQYGGMKAEEAKRLKELEEENKRLKKLLAEAELDKAILKEVLEGNS
jgi:transposase-like protein